MIMLPTTQKPIALPTRLVKPMMLSLLTTDFAATTVGGATTIPISEPYKQRSYTKVSTRSATTSNDRLDQRNSAFLSSKT